MYMSLPRYTIQQLEVAVKNNYSYQAVLKELGLNPYGGGSQSHIKKKIATMNLDTSHFVGQAIHKLKPQSERKPRVSSSYQIRMKLLKERPNRCDECLLEKWLTKPIPLEIHHIDGNRKNNKSENLQLLCCNCHRFTDNWGNRNL